MRRLREGDETHPLTPGRRRTPPAGTRTGREELADRWGLRDPPESADRRRKENRRNGAPRAASFPIARERGHGSRKLVSGVLRQRAHGGSRKTSAVLGAPPLTYFGARRKRPACLGAAEKSGQWRMSSRDPPPPGGNYIPDKYRPKMTTVAAAINGPNRRLRRAGGSHAKAATMSGATLPR